MTQTPERNTAGQLFTVTEGLFVACYPLSTALPIPLGVAGGDLLTWAFCGLGRGGQTPAVLLVFTAAGPPDRLGVATHFHELDVAFSPPAPVATLDPAAWTALCPAILGALRPATLDTLAGLLPHLGGALSGLAEPHEGPVGPVLAVTGEAEANLTGAGVPDYLLLRAGGLWRGCHVVRAHRTFGAEPRTRLDLTRVWGEPARSPTDAALLVRSGDIAAARVAP
ncbi:hypothetical protein [Methylobacterium gossipiicola]|uniref:Uncharacterized protein n=1 Tax=Methylobacterium gossipiicola TaxID=582675 RepID=A0A1I2RNW0_9HYPH|nr:hypothetical protein [Methylobacterium gossipiicola]SFG42202.1 hypothetical protein SAMN05192565_10338 [Methylobacterium gossipiicola]